MEKRVMHLLKNRRQHKIDAPERRQREDQRLELLLRDARDDLEADE